MDESGLYRPNVGIVVVDQQQCIFVGQRYNSSLLHWQMPQGGINQNEDLVTAAKRELLEETSICTVELVQIHNQWLYYDIPTQFQTATWVKQYRGQKQRWLLFKFLGQDDEININTLHPEFHSWTWMKPQDVLAHVVDFKKLIYRQILIDFALIKSF